MKYRSIPLTLIASALLVSGAALAADEVKPAAGQPAAATQSAPPAGAASASTASKPAEVVKPGATDAKKAPTDAKKTATKSSAQTKPAASGPTKAGPSESDASKTKAKAKKPKPIDINNASAEELKKIPGVGDAEAERIIKNRPYPTRSSLVERGVFPLEQYYSIKDYMVAVQPDPKASKTSKATKK